MLVSTSGSTGSSKLVRQSKTNLKSNTEAISKYLAISKKDTTITDKIIKIQIIPNWYYDQTVNVTELQK